MPDLNQERIPPQKTERWRTRERTLRILQSVPNPEEVAALTPGAGDDEARTRDKFEGATAAAIAASAVTRGVANLEDLITSVNPKTVSGDSVIFVQGYLTPGDGGGGNFRRVASNSGTEDGGTFFVSEVDDSYAWSRIETSPLNVKWFGASGDGVTDDTAEIQAAVDYIKARPYFGDLYIPSGLYRVSGPIDCVATNSSTRVNITGDGPRTSVIESTNGGKPILVQSGQYFKWSGFRVQYETQATEEDAVGILFVNLDNAANIGAHWCSIRDVWVNRASVGVRNQQGGSGTISGTVASGGNTVTAAGGVYTWSGYVLPTVGAYVRLTLDNGNTHLTTVASRSGSQLTLSDPLPHQASAGNKLEIYSSQFFNASVDNLIVENASIFGVWLGGAGTGSAWNNVYIRNGNQQSSWGSCVCGMLVAVHGQNVFNQLNLEAMAPTDSALKFLYCSGTVINSLHTEGVKLTTASSALLRVSGGPLQVNGWEVRSFETSGSITSALLRTGSWSFEEVTNWPAKVSIDGLCILGTKKDTSSSLVWVIADDSAENSSVTISSLVLRPNHGFPTQTVASALVSPSTSASILKELGTLIPAGVSGAIVGHAMNYTNDGRLGVWSRTSPQRVVFREARAAILTGAVGIYTGTAASGDAVLSPTPVTGVTGVDVAQTSTLTIANRTFSQGVLYLRTTSNEATGTILSSGSAVTFQRKGISTSTRGLVKWTFGSAHGLRVRDFLSVSGVASVPEINGQQEVVAVESSTVCYTYRWTGYTSSSDDSAHTESAIGITRYPTLDALLYP